MCIRDRQFDEINGRLQKASLRAIFFSSLVNPSTRFVNSVVDVYKRQIVQATSGEPEAVNTVLQYYGRRIRYASRISGQADKEAEDLSLIHIFNNKFIQGGYLLYERNHL